MNLKSNLIDWLLPLNRKSNYLVKDEIMNYSSRKVYRFRIVLNDIEPVIWRELDVPENYSFWDFHVALQDAMGWLNYHLHEFTPHKVGPTGGKYIGIPQGEAGRAIIGGWDVPIKRYFTSIGNTISYVYDFGDGWKHEVTLVGILLAEEGKVYPYCVAGERACPPEDCGGPIGYQRLLDTLASPQNENYDNIVEWLKGHAKKYWPYDPVEFSTHSVAFLDPDERFRIAFKSRN